MERARLRALAFGMAKGWGYNTAAARAPIRSDQYNNRALELTPPMLAALTRHLRAGRGRRVLLGGGRHRAVLDASGRVPTKHGVKAAQLHRQAHLGTFAALSLVHGARRAAELAEAARISVGRHWAALACNAQVGATSCGTFFRLDTVLKPQSLHSAPYCVRGCEVRCGSYKGLGASERTGGGDETKDGATGR